MKGRGALFLVLALLASALAGCGGAPVTVVVTPAPPTAYVTVVVTPAPPAEQEVATPAPVLPTEPATAAPPPPSPTVETSVAGIEVLEATFAHGLGEQMEPVDPGADFAPDETVYLSVKIKGRPKTGLVAAHFFWGEIPIAEATVDLADANSGVLFSIGEDTYAGYTLTHTEPFPLSDNYRADLDYNGAPLGSAPFRVVPPAGAIPSQITEVVLAKGADADYNPVEPSTEFAFDETVYLVGRGDLGVGTWLQAEWYVDGQVDEAGTRSLTMEENYQDVPFTFSFLPEGGWPEGEHEAVLIMNDREVGRFPFTVVAAP